MEGDPDFTRIRPIRVRIRLPVSVDEAFAFVADPRNDPQWVDVTPKVVQTDGDGLVVGARYRFEQTLIEDVTGEIVITDIAAPAFVAYRVEDPARIYRIEYRFMDKDGGCILEQASYPWFKSRKVQRMLWLGRPAMRLGLKRQMRALRDVLA